MLKQYITLWLAAQRLEIMENKIQMRGIAWSNKKLLKFVQLTEIENLMSCDSEHILKELIYIDHNYSSDSSNDSLTLIQ